MQTMYFTRDPTGGAKTIGEQRLYERVIELPVVILISLTTAITGPRK